MLLITEHMHGNVMTLMLVGRLDFLSRRPLQAAMAQAQASKPKEIILNFHRVTYIDTAGLALLMLAKRVLLDHSCKFKFVVVRGQYVQKVFDLVSMGKKFSIAVLEPSDTTSSSPQES